MPGQIFIAARILCQVESRVPTGFRAISHGRRVWYKLVETADRPDTGDQSLTGHIGSNESRQMTKDPLAENRLLRHRLEELMTQARNNERKMRRFQAQEPKLIGLNSLFELIETILYPDHSAFNWDLVTLWLLDAEYEIRRSLEEEGVDLKAHPSLMFARDR